MMQLQQQQQQYPAPPPGFMMDPAILGASTYNPLLMEHENAQQRNLTTSLWSGQPAYRPIPFPMRTNQVPMMMAYNQGANTSEIPPTQFQ